MIDQLISWWLRRDGYVRCDDCSGWFNQSHACGTRFQHSHIILRRSPR